MVKIFVNGQKVTKEDLLKKLRYIWMKLNEYCQKN